MSGDIDRGCNPRVGLAARFSLARGNGACAPDVLVQPGCRRKGRRGKTQYDPGRPRGDGTSTKDPPSSLPREFPRILDYVRGGELQRPSCVRVHARISRVAVPRRVIHLAPSPSSRHARDIPVISFWERAIPPARSWHSDTLSSHIGLPWWASECAVDVRGAGAATLVELHGFIMKYFM